MQVDFVQVQKWVYEYILEIVDILEMGCMAYPCSKHCTTIAKILLRDVVRRYGIQGNCQVADAPILQVS